MPERCAQYSALSPKCSRAGGWRPPAASALSDQGLFLEEGDAVAEYLRVAVEPFRIFPRVHLLQCPAAVFFHVVPACGLLGFYDNGPAVIIVQKDDVRTAKSLLLV